MEDIILKKGKSFVYGDDVDTDVIIPARYLNTSVAAELAEHCMEDIDKDFHKNVQNDDFIIAGDNFGCGSSREHAPIAIKASEHDKLPDETKNGDEISMDLDNGVVKNLTTGKEYKIAVYPKEIQELIDIGGLVNYTKKKLGV